MRIDAHQHFWAYTREEYGWIDEGLAQLRHDFLPDDIEREIALAGIGGVISVQARQTETETRWLLDLAGRYTFIKGVVGWLDLANPRVEAEIEAVATNPKLKGLRHVVQDEPDDDFVLSADFNRGIEALGRFRLAYDLLVFPRQLRASGRFVDRHPYQTFVLDHLGKPPIRTSSMEPWSTLIRDLAERPNVYCKVSGMVTEADFERWTEAGLRAYFEIALEAFGPKRLMFGSDWPVCLVASGYRRWCEVVSRWIARLSREEQDRVLGGTAMEAYKL
jgi:L-fuconolactonase